MNGLKTYQKNGYKIQATEKAYNLFYKKQGFVPVDAEDSAEKAELLASMKVSELKAYLRNRGIEFPEKAGKKELLVIAQNVSVISEETEDMVTEPEDEGQDDSDKALVNPVDGNNAE